MTEQIKYHLIKKIDDIEIRQYPELLIASVKNKDDTTAFGILFNYISGDNQTSKKIPMTSPVLSSEKISMTAPVISKNDYFAFVLPDTYNTATVPIPNNSEITIEFTPKKILAVIRFSGRANKKSIYKQVNILKEILKKENLKVKGESFLMRYNSPFTPGFLRRNEIAIELIDFEK
jgi:hypothetical protein